MSIRIFKLQTCWILAILPLVLLAQYGRTIPSNLSDCHEKCYMTDMNYICSAVGDACYYYEFKTCEWCDGFRTNCYDVPYLGTCIRHSFVEIKQYAVDCTEDHCPCVVSTPAGTTSYVSVEAKNLQVGEKHVMVRLKFCDPTK
jgi:hypothetical protein